MRGCGRFPTAAPHCYRDLVRVVAPGQTSGAQPLSTWVPRHNSSPTEGADTARAKRLDLRTRVEAAHPERRYSTAGVDLGVIERRTWEHRERLAEAHDRRARQAAADSERAPPYLYSSNAPGVPFLGPWWDSGAKGLKDWGRYEDGDPLPRIVKRVRRRRGESPRKVLVPAKQAFESQSRWHEARARGQRRRCVTVGHCGDGEVHATCACGHLTTAPILCGCIRLCFRCMARRAHKQRRRFMRAYSVILREGLQAGRYRRTHPGGRWSDKHLVLTVPHLEVRRPGGEIDRAATAAKRIKVLLSAWDDFARSMQRWLRKHKQYGARFYRCFEWTLGKDGLGHPHLHIWIHGPWLPEHDSHRVRGLYVACERRRPGANADTVCPHCPKGRTAKTRRGVRSWWAAALAKQGVGIDASAVNITLRSIRFRCIEFVREIRKPNGVTYQQRSVRVAAEGDGDPVHALIRYFEPWSIAAADPETGEQASEDVLAAVYCALEGKRMSQGSRGFLGLGDVTDPVCKGCGYCAAKRVDVRPWDQKEKGADYRRPEAARGPPTKPLPPDARNVSSERVIDAQAFTRLLEQAAEDLRTQRGKPRDPWGQGREAQRIATPAELARAAALSSFGGRFR